MSTANRNLGAVAPVSKIDATDWTRELWLEAFAMARRMIVAGKDHGLATRWTWYLGHARRRFTTPASWRIAQAAGRAVFDRRTVTFAASGSIEELARQGLVRRTRRPRPGNLTATVPYRAASFERLRDCGLNLAWGHDPLMSSNNRGLRVQRARRLKAERRAILAEVRAEERQVAMAMAEDRFALTLTGLFALQNAERGKA
jgi:hypothetical protein